MKPVWKLLRIPEIDMETDLDSGKQCWKPYRIPISDYRNPEVALESGSEFRETCVETGVDSGN